MKFKNLPKLDKPHKLADILDTATAADSPYVAVLIPGGHGAFNQIPQSRDVQRVLDWALANDKFIITLCHGPAALDEGTNIDIGYMPGKLPWLLTALAAVGHEGDEPGHQ